MLPPCSLRSQGDKKSGAGLCACNECRSILVALILPEILAVKMAIHNLFVRTENAPDAVLDVSQTIAICQNLRISLGYFISKI